MRFVHEPRRASSTFSSARTSATLSSCGFRGPDSRVHPPQKAGVKLWKRLLELVSELARGDDGESRLHGTGELGMGDHESSGGAELLPYGNDDPEVIRGGFRGEAGRASTAPSTEVPCAIHRSSPGPMTCACTTSRGLRRKKFILKRLGSRDRHRKIDGLSKHEMGTRSRAWLLAEGRMSWSWKTKACWAGKLLHEPRNSS